MPPPPELPAPPAAAGPTSALSGAKSPWRTVGGGALGWKSKRSWNTLMVCWAISTGAGRILLGSVVHSAMTGMAIKHSIASPLLILFSQLLVWWLRKAW